MTGLHISSYTPGGPLLLITNKFKVSVASLIFVDGRRITATPTESRVQSSIFARWTVSGGEAGSKEETKGMDNMASRRCLGKGEGAEMMIECVEP